jgi:LacI family transcriptional regulator
MCKKTEYHVALDSYDLGSITNEYCIGVMAFAKEAGNWCIYSDRFGYGRALKHNLSRLNGRLSMETLQRAATFQKKHSIPVVTFHTSENWNGQACIYSDHEEVIDLAVRHFQEAGLTDMAFCGANNKTSSSVRERHWRSRMLQIGFESHVFNQSPLTLKNEAQWREAQKKLKAWLLTLPRPCGVLACEDGRAAEVILAAEKLELHIPEDIILLGINDDQLICEGSPPTLSSINIHAREIGYEAAKLLHEYMTGDRKKGVELTIAPKGITKRESTAIFYLDDKCIEAVVKKIRTVGKQKRLSVAELHKGVSLSLRSFYYRFEKAMGCSPKNEIDRVTLSTVLDYLNESEYSINEISFRVGFDSPDMLSRFFQKQLKISPSEYRKLNRKRNLPG